MEALYQNLDEWTALLTEQERMFLQMLGGGEPMRMMSGGEEMLRAETAAEVQEEVLPLQECVEFLEKIWEEDPQIQKTIDAEDWKQFMDAVYQEYKHKTETLSEKIMDRVYQETAERQESF